MPDYTDGELVQIADNLFDRTKDPTINIRERTWYRNILYYIGEQWIEWLIASGTFRRLKPSEFAPTPVTNIIRDHVRSMKALIMNKDFQVRVWPNSMDQEDRDAAKMGEFLLQHMDSENDEAFIDETEKVAIWRELCGIGLMRVFPVVADKDWGLDEKGMPISKSQVESVAWSPFNYSVSPYGDDQRSKPYIGLKSLRRKEWVEDTFKVPLSSEQSHESNINYERKLAKLVSAVSPWKGRDLENMNEYEFDAENLVILRELEFRPTKEYPDGRYVGLVGDQKVFDYDRLPIPVQREDRLKWYYSITDYRYHYVPGRYWPDAGIDDLISPQNTINEIDQDLNMNRKSLGRPIVVLSTDANIKRVTKWGQHLLVLKYDPYTSGGAKPEIEQGTPYPAQILEERNIHRGAAQDAAGDPKNVLRGSAPTAQASGVMVDILRDAAEQGHFPDILRFYRSHKRTYRKRLLLAQELYTDQRMLKIAGQGHGVEVRAFRSSDLKGNTDVRLELSSGVASTRVGQTQMMINLTNAGFFNQDSPLDPEFRDEILRRIGLSGFKDKINVDVDRAREENQRLAMADEDGMTVAEYEEEGGIIETPVIDNIFLSIANPMPMMDPQSGQPVLDPMTGQPQPGEPIVLSEDPLFEYDNHSVHYEVHRKFLLSSEFKSLPERVQEIAIAHTFEHKKMMEIQIFEAQQSAALAAAGAQPPAEAEGGLAIEDITGPTPQGAGAPTPVQAGFQ